MESLIFPLLIALLAVPLFLQARKQKRTMQEQQRLQSSLTVGDKVMTTSGLVGTIVGTDEEQIELEIAPGVNTTWVRAAVRERLDTESAEDAVADDDSIDDDSSDDVRKDNDETATASTSVESDESTKTDDVVEESKTR